MRRCVGIAACLLAISLTAVAQEAVPKAKAKSATDPAFAAVKDQPGLPRVLLIGDSISIGYTVAVRERLAGKANVHRIPTNGGPTTNGLARLPVWLGDSKWDVIHFNWGLHDLKYVKGDSADLADPKAEGSRRQVSPADYEKNLTQLVQTLKATNAKLIWCTTTPVPEGSTGRVAEDEVLYNQIAAKVMTAADVPTNDLCAHARAKLAEVQLPKNVHFTEGGSRYLAEKVAAAIAEHLPKP